MKKTLRPITILKRKRRHGFRVRMSTKSGRSIIKHRRQKKKWVLTA